MPDWRAYAAQIRDLIEAQAPQLKSVTDQLPDEALLGAGPAALILVLVLVFLILGALGGGKKKKARREAMLRELEEQDDLPKPQPARPAPARPARPAPAAEQKSEPPELDKRGEALIEALARARAPNAEPVSSEGMVALQEAAARVVKDNGGALKALTGGDVTAGFAKLAEDAAALERTKKPKAAQVWRDLAVLAEGVDSPRALQAAESSFALDNSNFHGAMYLARMRAAADKPRDALDAAHSAIAAAKGPREKAMANAEYGEASMRLNRPDEARTAFRSAVDAMRTLARTGEARAQHDLSVCLNKLGDLEASQKNLEAARALFEEDLQIARHLAKTSPGSVEAQRDLIISLIKVAQMTNDRAQWEEATQTAEAFAKTGKMPQSDAWMLDALRKQMASVK